MRLAAPRVRCSAEACGRQRETQARAAVETESKCGFQQGCRRSAAGHVRRSPCVTAPPTTRRSWGGGDAGAMPGVSCGRCATASFESPPAAGGLSG